MDDLNLKTENAEFGQYLLANIVPEWRDKVSFLHHSHSSLLTMRN